MEPLIIFLGEKIIFVGRVPTRRLTPTGMGGNGGDTSYIRIRYSKYRQGRSRFSMWTKVMATHCRTIHNIGVVPARVRSNNKRK